jgi:TPR repeat protein
MSNLDHASNPELSVLEFKELLDLEDVEIYEALDLNESASQRYMDYILALPEVEYLPSAEDFDGETLEKANAGDHLAQFLMAIQCKEQGDLKGESDWFRKSAENGNIVAAFNHGITLSDPNEQLPWFYKAAFKGFHEAQREVGRILYEQGDSITAQKWFGLAIRRDNVMALNDMGVLHWHDNNSTLAEYFWREAAELGDESAIANLEMASSTSLFDDDLDFNESDNDYSQSPRNYQPQPIRVEESTKRAGFEIL